MITNRIWWACGIASVMAVTASLAAQTPIDTTFTYQGRLTDGSQPVDGQVQFIFRLFNAAVGGQQVGPTLIEFDWPVTDGLFIVPLNFGDVFQGDKLWLDVRVNATQLTPRQLITAAPYALHAVNGGSGGGGGCEPCGPAGGDLVGAYPAPTIALGVVDSSKLALDSQSLSQVSGNALRVSLVGSSPTVIGGHANNEAPGLGGSVIAGGGSAGSPNRMLNGNADFSVIGGGIGNLIDAFGAFSVIAGGEANRITEDAQWGAILGGRSNEVRGFSATVLGGELNRANGNNSVAAGWESTANGVGSFALGRNTLAAHGGTFIWGDNCATATLQSTEANQWSARAAGGVRFFTNCAMTSGVQVGASGNSWSSVSDRAMKENFAPVDARGVLEALAALPMTTWNYISEGPEVRRMGPMAQDFWPAFGLGDDPMRISTIDADGVALAAIQGLYEVIKDQREVIDAQAETIARLERELATIGARLESITIALTTGMEVSR